MTVIETHGARAARILAQRLLTDPTLIALAVERFNGVGAASYPDDPILRKTVSELNREAAEELADAICYVSYALARSTL